MSNFERRVEEESARLDEDAARIRAREIEDARKEAADAEATAQLRRQQADLMNQKAAIVKAWEDRNRRRIGTDPRRVFTPEEARQCHEFIEYMGQRAYKGATRLHHKIGTRTLGKPAWSTGYGIGSIILGQRTKGHDLRKLLAGTTLDHNVFLCADSLLRFYISPAAARNPYRYVNSYERDERPAIVQDLPLETPTPSRLSTPSIRIGNLVHEWTQGTIINYSSANCASEIESTPSPIYGWGDNKLFRKRTLDDVLTSYALAA
jgi:hypothetical protein